MYMLHNFLLKINASLHCDKITKQEKLNKLQSNSTPVLVL